MEPGTGHRARTTHNYAHGIIPLTNDHVEAVCEPSLRKLKQQN